MATTLNITSTYAGEHAGKFISASLLSANTIYKDYYIDVAIGTKEDSLYGTDYSSYFKSVSEDGVFYVNSFVDLNQKTDPFEYWTNDGANGDAYIPHQPM